MLLIAKDDNLQSGATFSFRRLRCTIWEICVCVQGENGTEEDEDMEEHDEEGDMQYDEEEEADVEDDDDMGIGNMQAWPQEHVQRI